MSNDLQRERAPFSAAAWAEIDEEAKKVLELMLAGRKVCDFSGPLGWHTSVVDTGRTKALSADGGVSFDLRLSQPLVELRAPFELSRRELEAVDRGAKDVELEPVIQAAKALALAEDGAIFNGHSEACIAGICEVAAASKVSLSSDYLAYPDAVVEAVEKLKKAGVDGPYALVLGPRCYAGLTKTRTNSGYPVLNHVRKLLDGPIVWAPAVDGAVVLSQRGGDFELSVGRDISIGYWDHSGETVQLYLQESLTFRVLAPEAAIPLVYT